MKWPQAPGPSTQPAAHLTHPGRGKSQTRIKRREHLPAAAVELGLLGQVCSNPACGLKDEGGQGEGEGARADLGHQCHQFPGFFVTTDSRNHNRGIILNPTEGSIKFFAG